MRTLLMGYKQPGGGGRQPGANTILYCPLNSTYTYTDQSGNNVPTTSNGVSFGTYTSSNVDCAYFDNNGGHRIVITSMSGNYLNMTISIRSYITAITASNPVMYMLEGNSTNISIQPTNGYLQSQTYHNGDYFITDGSGMNAWHHCVVTWDNGTSKFYVDGQYIGSNSGSGIIYMKPSEGAIGGHMNTSNIFSFGGYLSNAIAEDKTRTAQDVLDYFNQTKSLYGIS